jgi:hypothetical protein
VALERIFQSLGLALPYAYAVGTYMFFLYLDKKASGAAKTALSSWLKDEPYNKFDLRAGVVAVFDGIYGTPLVSWTAIRRSAFYSIIAMLLWNVFVWKLRDLRDFGFDIYLIKTYIPALSTAIISDYLSLFIVKAFLKSDIALITKFIVALVAGVLTVIVLYGVGFVLSDNIVWVNGNYDWSADHAVATNIPAALVVFLWLPAFALGALVFRMLKPFTHTVRWMQWFIKRGSQHPFEAIGLTAAVPMFLIATFMTIAQHSF